MSVDGSLLVSDVEDPSDGEDFSEMKINWFRAAVIVGGGLVLVYLLIRLGKSPLALFIP